MAIIESKPSQTAEMKIFRQMQNKYKSHSHKWNRWIESFRYFDRVCIFCQFGGNEDR